MTLEELQELYPELLIPVGFEEALVGVGIGLGAEVSAVFDASKLSQEAVSSATRSWPVDEPDPTFIIEKLD